MKDNLSIVILMIVFVMLVVMFPLYNFFERQDDMSYNLALRATTTFVDKVLNYGYMDMQMYDEFVTSLASTGNLYDIQIEGHIQTITKDPDNPNSEIYTVQERIEYNDQIFDYIGDPDINSATLVERNVKNGMYKLNIGDGFYVKLKNANTTMAGALFNSIISTSSEERIVINYGGIVKNNAWYKIDANYEVAKDEITLPSYSGVIPPVTPNKPNQPGGNTNQEKPKHVHTDACYKKCEGEFELIKNAEVVMHSHTLYDTPLTNANGMKVITETIKCPSKYKYEEKVYYKFFCTRHGRENGRGYLFKYWCDTCGSNPEKIWPELCRECYFEKNPNATEADYNKAIDNLYQQYLAEKEKKYKDGTHNRNRYIYQFINIEKIYRCKTCDASYKVVNKYDFTCPYSKCKVVLNSPERVIGIKDKHNETKICGFD